MRTRRAIYPATAVAAVAAVTATALQGSKLTRISPLIVSSEAPPKCPRLGKKARIRSPKTREDSYGDDLLLSSSFDKLPDDLLLSILVSLISRAASPNDFFNTILTCKRFQKLACNPLVLRNASESALRVKASQWCPAASTFLSKCADAGNMEACFTLGMIRFYCLMERKEGLEMMARAGRGSHAGALHALAVIQFNGSGGGRMDKNLRAGVRLCARAAALCHVDAMRELGHCLQDGYGVPRNVLHGRRLILEANVREASVATKCERSRVCLGCAKGVKSKSDSFHSLYKFIHTSGCCSLLSDFGCSVPPPTLHIAHEFLLGWFHLKPLPSGLRLCSHANCGRPETRKHEFRRCSACGHVNYCSRACQALDWKLQHKLHCASSILWQDHTLAALVGFVGGGGALYIDDFGD